MSQGAPRINVAAARQKASTFLKIDEANVEQNWWPLYDYTTYPAAGSSSLKFFQAPVGQAGKTVVDTNMKAAGSLPAGTAYLVTGVQVEFYPGVAISGIVTSKFADDIYTVYRQGYLVFTIGSKEYINGGNLMKFAPRNHLSMFSATTVATDRYTYATAVGEEFKMVERWIESTVNFDVELRGLPALPSAVDGRIGVTLNGYQFRNRQ